MRECVPSIKAQAEAQAKELLHAIDAAEGVIVSTIERECEALRAGRLLAADALRLRLRDAARLYLGAMRATRASFRAIEPILPDLARMVEDRRHEFSSLLKVELAVLATERAAAETGLNFAAEQLAPRLAPAPAAPSQPMRRRTSARRQTRMRRAS